MQLRLSAPARRALPTALWGPVGVPGRLCARSSALGALLRCCFAALRVLCCAPPAAGVRAVSGGDRSEHRQEERGNGAALTGTPRLAAPCMAATHRRACSCAVCPRTPQGPPALRLHTTPRHALCAAPCAHVPPFAPASLGSSPGRSSRATIPRACRGRPPPSTPSLLSSLFTLPPPSPISHLELYSVEFRTSWFAEFVPGIDGRPIRISEISTKPFVVGRGDGWQLSEEDGASSEVPAGAHSQRTARGCAGGGVALPCRAVSPRGMHGALAEPGARGGREGERRSGICPGRKRRGRAPALRGLRWHA